MTCVGKLDDDSINLFLPPLLLTAYRRSTSLGGGGGGGGRPSSGGGEDFAPMLNGVVGGPEDPEDTDFLSILQDIPAYDMNEGGGGGGGGATPKGIPNVAFVENRDGLFEVVPTGESPLPGAHLPFRSNRLCRVGSCENRYRSPGYLCETHGGGQCQAEGCIKLHQGRQGLADFFFCRFHRKRYGEITQEGVKMS